VRKSEPDRRSGGNRGRHMSCVLNFPLPFLLLSLVVLWLAERIGVSLPRKLTDGERDDFNLVTGATLTLLGLIIGFSFSMAISRYDERKNYEEAEANAIGTEYVRAGLLPVADAARVRALLEKYTDQRVLFYGARDDSRLRQINAATAQLQTDLWSAVQTPAMAQPTPLVALAVAGMNDVLNSQGYTQAAWWNRIPTAAWALMLGIAICSHVLIGHGLSRGEGKSALLAVLPLVVSISFFLIADIDSPRRGMIRVLPENLLSLAQSLSPHSDAPNPMAGHIAPATRKP
jgi:hypothetical protein